MVHHRHRYAKRAARSPPLQLSSWHKHARAVAEFVLNDEGVIFAQRSWLQIASTGQHASLYRSFDARQMVTIHAACSTRGAPMASTAKTHVGDNC